MGGFGSGRTSRYGSKDTVDSRSSIDIHYIKKHCSLLPGYSGTLYWSRNGHQTGSISFSVTDDGVILDYSAAGESFRYTVPIVYSSCNYGGGRPWFECPKCSRRVGKITLSRKMFVCRRCGNLAYQSQRDNTEFRLLSKSQKLRKRLGGSLSTFDPIPWKPKGMHWRTYWRTRERINDYELQMFGAMAASMDTMTKKMSAAR